MTRVVPDQKSKFETDELFRKLSRESEVIYFVLISLGFLVVLLATYKLLVPIFCYRFSKACQFLELTVKSRSSRP